MNQKVLYGWNTKGDLYVCFDGMPLKSKIKTIKDIIFKSRVQFAVYRTTAKELGDLIIYRDPFIEESK